MKAAGPLLGYNNNVPYRGHVYHVQTEDSGTQRPHVITHLFADGGRIIKTTKTSYAEHLEGDNLPDRVRALMREQHKRMVLALRDGELDALLEHHLEVSDNGGGAPSETAVPEALESEPAVSAPIELVDRISPPPLGAPASLRTPDDQQFYQEVEELLPPSAPAGSSSVSGHPDDPRHGTLRSATPPSAGAYSLIASRNSPPPRGSRPPGSGRGLEGSALPGMAGRHPGGSMKPIPPASRAPTTSRPPQTVAFGERFVSERRFDEVVLAFLRREGVAIDGVTS